MPFVTESVWQALGGVARRRGLPEPAEAAESVCIAPWPSYPDAWHDAEAEFDVAQWQEKIAPSGTSGPSGTCPRTPTIEPLILAEGRVADAPEAGRAVPPGPRAGAGSVTVAATADRPADCAVAVLADAEIVLPLEGLIDPEAECAKLEKSPADLDKQLGGVRAKLGNESFVAKAPAEVVEQQRTRLAELEAQQARSLDGRLAELSEKA